VTDTELLEVLNAAAGAVAGALTGLADWGPAGTRPGQYHSDLIADEAALRVLDAAGLGVLSEETGDHNRHRELLVALDPVDGSTNASRRLPWYATSLCLLDAEGPRVGVVVNLATGDRYEAIRGGGARHNGKEMRPTACTTMADALVGVVGFPEKHLGWRQVRALGAAALDLCAVATGQLDAFIDCSLAGHAPWDYLAAALICGEAGAPVVDRSGRSLDVRTGDERRSPVAAATPALLEQAVAARAGVS
jgi:fructose-1,6-bisphosphatase/inositol monophosphatase family enzyme